MPEDQANAVAFLCSDEADFITGQAINVCGGQLLRELSRQLTTISSPSISKRCSTIEDASSM